MRRDYYAVLGIAATAAPREVRRAYQRLARQYSPDVNFWDERARELFEEIAEAFRVLGDPNARQMYDRFGHAAGADDALAEGRRGDDVHAVVELSFAGVVRGTGARRDRWPCVWGARSGAEEIDGGGDGRPVRDGWRRGCDGARRAHARAGAPARAADARRDADRARALSGGCRVTDRGKPLYMIG